MNVSTSLNVFEKEHPIRLSVERCRTAGFTCLDFNYWDHQPDIMRLSWSEEKTWAEDARAAADTFGVRFTQMHGPVHGDSFTEMVSGLTFESFLELTKRSLHTAQILGVPWVVLHATVISLTGNEPYGQVLDFNCRFFQKLIPTLEATKVGIAIENIFDRINPVSGPRYVRRRYCSVAEELVELIDSINHPLVGACWDTGHAHTQALGQGEGIRLLGNRLKATHIQDTDGGLKDHHFLPYYGTIDWDEVLRALAAVNYAGDFTYEAHNSVRALPDGLRDDALVYAVKLGSFLIKRFNEL